MMRRHRPFLTLVALLTLVAAVQAQTPDPYLPLYRHLLGFARDSTFDGNNQYVFEDIEADDLPTPGSYHGGKTLSADGASISYTANTYNAGYLAAKNDTTLSITNLQAQGYYTIAGQGSHTQVQFFAPITPAEATFNWRITGAASTPYGTATSRFDFLAGQYPGSGINDLFSLPHLLHYGTGNISYNLPTTLSGPIDIYYWSSAFIELPENVANGHVGETFDAFANFSSTYILESIELRDSNGDLIPSWTMEDTSNPGVALFDQNGRTAAAGSSAPEPGSLLFLGLGGTLIFIRRRIKGA